MVKKKKTQSGLMSSAGLMRYYDADKSAIAINPKTIMVVGIVAAVTIFALNAYYGLWP